MIKIKTWFANLRSDIKRLSVLDQTLTRLEKEIDSVQACPVELKDIHRTGPVELKDIHKTGKSEPEKAISDLQEGEKFLCHYCGKEFPLLAKDIFPTSVRLLYKESYVTGKGVLCPHCQKTCITG